MRSSFLVGSLPCLLVKHSEYGILILKTCLERQFNCIPKVQSHCYCSTIASMKTRHNLCLCLVWTTINFSLGCYKAEPQLIFNNLKDAQVKVFEILEENGELIRQMRSKERERVDKRDNMLMLSIQASVSDNNRVTMLSIM